jgi:hypothetical protein
MLDQTVQPSLNDSRLGRTLRPIACVVACFIVLTLCGRSPSGTATATGEGEALSVATGDAALAQAFADHAENLEIEGQGTVLRLLADDTEGDRHQRFIVQLASGQTLLVTHNTDVAPRVTSLQVGDAIEFKGEYVWNAQGGLIHWTHRDPDGGHEPGWIKHSGMTYE